MTDYGKCGICGADLTGAGVCPACRKAQDEAEERVRQATPPGCRPDAPLVQEPCRIVPVGEPEHRTDIDERGDGVPGVDYEDSEVDQDAIGPFEAVDVPKPRFETTLSPGGCVRTTRGTITLPQRDNPHAVDLHRMVTEAVDEAVRRRLSACTGTQRRKARPGVCPVCAGSGVREKPKNDSTMALDCDACGGSGEVEVSDEVRPVERDGVWCCPGPRCGSATDGCNGTAECRAPDGPPGSGAYIGEPCIITGGDAPAHIQSIPEVRNGQVWRQPTGSCNTRVVLWVEGDAWMLLGAPRRGEPAMPCSFGGVLLVPRQRITDHLRTRGYVLTGDYLIVHKEEDR